ncbi:hypothetical protein [Natronoglycomyces albus]|uniref:Uncharacterized protein n=1 Tax=Natronoglycomyces albus TaxID=2811108 RepID=A0A895XM94_9ACTN|nr:hypothetical protein [Natronoglycomyces albus]QSB06237.1 hypothetical protein JQS30_04835 [Natronoglycomyces albus]
MGRIVRNVSDGVTKYYWYPGEKGDWVKAAITVVGGAAVFALSFVAFHNSLISAVLSASVVLGLGGVYLGRSDAAGLSKFHDPTSERREAMADSAHAAWRGTLMGFASAGAAIFVLNMPHDGFLSNWVLPIVPSVVGAIAHSAGMIYERMNQAGQAEAEPPPAEVEAAKELEKEPA